MNLISIPALADNYIWLLHNDDLECIIVDPGEAAPVFSEISARGLTPKALLLTHHHADHVGGVREICAQFAVPVYGPQETAARGATEIVAGGSEITLLNHRFSVLDLPGHTLGHIGFYSLPYLFCGDTVFSAGCGRLFEGSPKQMHESFQKVNSLPPETLVCGAHEYTLNNLAFARSVLPQDELIAGYEREIKQLRAKQQPSLPTTLHLERKINLFLRCHDADLQKILGTDYPDDEQWRVFALLREKKDHF
ncbi:hydroxyacylglutathione hydrolase [Biostraticola tofi]|uniref:Hydroxyacylglutathione hydrolase n=1 Tax=Biostraticola tofi TaxID=466109 RepID=A0A4R3YKH8_9GAMM|nr:hydroxyacylglutathione hydrolase [Biostraticola tofi]TCV91544.1 hydroxyacylglutathione hydrolase [Biostraticola tofi]